MERVLSRQMVTAKKHYRCNASEQWLRVGGDINECETGGQRLAVEGAQADRWRIFPGRDYIKATGIHEGKIVTYRARPDMDRLCIELGLFEE